MTSPRYRPFLTSFPPSRKTTNDHSQIRHIGGILDHGVEAEAQPCTIRDPNRPHWEGKRSQAHVPHCPSPSPVQIHAEGSSLSLQFLQCCGSLFVSLGASLALWGVHSYVWYFTTRNLIMTDKREWGWNNWHLNLGKLSSYLQC